ncbi:MAG: flavin monoamine oxidase family protein [Cyclobacteriaceae bacterium]
MSSLNNPNPKVVIIGAGLCGLLIANRLKNLEVSVLVLEARNRIGGRIFTLAPENGPPLEMGATWFGTKHTNLTQLLQELNLPYFEQYIKGTAYFEPFSTAPPQAIELPQRDSTFRIAGGSNQIINNLAEGLNKDELLLNHPVQELNFEQANARAITKDFTIDSEYIISTVPPALLVNSVQFEPHLPDALVDIAQHTQTWMQDAIKTAVIYEDAFWRNKQLSGTIFSNVGPLNEFYDHTDYESAKFALCGFVNGAFTGFTINERKERVNAQLSRIFGQVAMDQISYVELIWANEEYTKDTKSIGLYPHQNNGHYIYESSWFDNRMFIAGSETSKEFPRYMDGAVYSALSTAEKIINLINE